MKQTYAFDFAFDQFSTQQMVFENATKFLLEGVVNGYNATVGGDGKPYIDYDLVVSTYQEVKNCSEVARIMNICVDTVRYILKERKIEIVPSQIVTQKKTGKIVNQYTLEGDFIQSYPSLTSAAQSLGKVTTTSRGATTHISDVCKGKRKTAYGYKWEWGK